MPQHLERWAEEGPAMVTKKESEQAWIWGSNLRLSNDNDISMKRRKKVFKMSKDFFWSKLAMEDDQSKKKSN